MSARHPSPPRAVTLWSHRAGALFLTALLVLAGCTAGPRVRREAPDGQGHVFAVLPTNFAPVQVGEAEFTAALADMMLEMPLAVASSHPEVSGRWRRTSCRSSDGSPTSELLQSYARLCARRGTPGDCLTLLDDGPLLESDDKRQIALALALGPALEGVSAEVDSMLDPVALLSVVSVSLAVYLALLVAPEPASKGVVAAFTLLLWGYLGWEFFELIRAYVQLSEDSARATRFVQLEAAGERFGRVIGPNSVRILVMVGTATVGESAALLSRARKLPGFGAASRNAEAHGGLFLAEAAAGAEGVIVSVPEGAVRAVLPRHATAMVARGAGTAGKQAQVLFRGHRAFKSFEAFKSFMGRAGKDKAWHHLVEQHKSNTARFGPEALHNTENVILLDKELHNAISAYYSRKLPGMRQTVREWLKSQSYEAQREFGLKILREFGWTP